MFWLICAVLLLCLMFTVEKDEENVQKNVMQSIQTTINNRELTKNQTTVSNNETNESTDLRQKLLS